MRPKTSPLSSDEGRTENEGIHPAGGSRALTQKTLEGYQSQTAGAAGPTDPSEPTETGREYTWDDVKRTCGGCVEIGKCPWSSKQKIAIDTGSCEDKYCGDL